MNTNKRNMTKILSGIAMFTLLLSCQQEEFSGVFSDAVMRFTAVENVPDLSTKGLQATSVEEQPAEFGFESVRFGIRMQESVLEASPLTKVTPYNSTDGIGQESIKVWCYLVSSADQAIYSYSGAPAYPGTYPVLASYDSKSKLWKPKPSVALPSASGDYSQVHFYAYAPASDKVTCTYPKNSQDATVFALKYTVPVKVDEQIDLLAADTRRSISETGSVSLQFSHILAGVRFKVANDVTVRSLTLEGIHDEGSFNMKTGEWGSLAKKGNVYTLGPVGSSENNVSTAGRVSSFNGELTWMMIPQVLPASATLVAILDDGTTDGLQVSAPLPGHKWKAGTLVTYDIFRNTDFQLEVSGDISSENGVLFPAGGGTRTLSVSSYNQKKIGNAENMPWSLQFYESEENARKGLASTNVPCPSWLQVSAAGGPGSPSGESLTLTAESGIVSTPLNGTASLQSASVKGSSASPHNLANPDGSSAIVETANSYIVNAPGWYRLPLVAGNGYKNSAVNTRALKGYNGTAAEYFKDYLDQSFDDPRLHKSSTLVSSTSESGETCPNQAVVVWEESQLIDGATAGNGWVIPNALTYDSANDIWWLKFQITPEAIREGGAVLAVRDKNDRIMWSWFIWATDFVSGNDISVQRTSSAQVNFMPVNLGWVDESVLQTAQAAEVFLRLSQEEGGKYFVIRVSREEMDLTVMKGHAPYFQWGRKDALNPQAPQGGILAGEAMPVSGTDPVTLGTVIQNPGKFYPQDALDNIYTACVYWWNAANNANINNDGNVTKTIFDPCPPSYRMPRRNEFEAFSAVHGNSFIPYYDSEDNYTGVAFYKDFRGESYSGGETIFFPANGSLNHQTGVYSKSIDPDGQNDGSCWTAIPLDGTNANRFWFNSSFWSVSYAVTSGAGDWYSYVDFWYDHYNDNGDWVPLNVFKKGTGLGVRPVKM